MPGEHKEPDFEAVVALVQHFDWLRIWAGVWIFHFALAVAGWSWLVYIMLQGPNDSVRWDYIGVRMMPCAVMLAGFTVATVHAKRRRRLTKWLVAVLTVVTLGWFGFDAYRHDYQIQAMTDHGCEHSYVTWWWYNDRWDATR